MDYSVYVQAAGRPSDPPLTLEQLEDLAERLAIASPAVSGSVEPQQERGWSIQLHIADAHDSQQAHDRALRLVGPAAEELHFPPWPVVKVEVTEWERFITELERPNRPELVGVTELADLAGVSRQRASILARRSGFPEPVAELASGPVWERRQVERFLADWSRRPGRPAKQPAAADERFLNVWEVWREELLFRQRRRPTTILDYRYVLQDWFEWCKGQGRDWRKVRPAHLERYLGQLPRARVPGRPLAPATYSDAILQFYEFAASKRARLLARNPLQGVTPEQVAVAAEPDPAIRATIRTRPLGEADFSVPVRPPAHR
jgi:Phage integrase, N-terminal SAM-like domain